MDTSATQAEAVTDTINSCKAGCELQWPGILNLDKGETVGRYYTSNKTKHDINTCPDLSKYAPKVKLGGKCDASEECETNCATDLNLGDSDVYWRCVERVCKNVCDAY